MKCVATEMGYTKNGRVREGVIFEMPDGATGSWFHPVGGAPTTATAPKAAGNATARPAANARSPNRKPRMRRTPRTVKQPEDWQVSEEPTE